MRLFTSLPAAVAWVFGAIIYVLLTYLSLWILAWALYWCGKYSFLPWPH